MGSLNAAAGVLAQLRSAVGLTQQSLAIASGVSVRTIHGLESGAIKEPHRSTLLALAGPLRLRGQDLTSFTQSWRAEFGAPLSLAEILQRHHVACSLTDALETQSVRLREVLKVCASVIDEHGRLAEITVTRSFEALVDGVDRVVWIQNFDPRTVCAEDIIAEGLTNCRAGQAAVLSDSVLGYEMLLDTAVRAGDMFLVSYRTDLRTAYRHDGPVAAPETESLTGTTVGVAVHVEQVAFSAPHLPARLWQVSQRSLPAHSPPQKPLQLSPVGVVQAVWERPHPGVHGIRWTWDPV